MLRSSADIARRSVVAVKLPELSEVIIRSYRDDDFEEVRRLYHDGVLTESVNPPDPVTDCSFLHRRYLDRPQNHFWVAEAHGKVIASVGLTEDENRVGHVRRLRVCHDWLGWHEGDVVRMLITQAAEHAQQYDQLKLIIHTALHDERAVAFLHQLGFEFARIRDRDGQHLLEFYLNIYNAPRQRHPLNP